MIKRQTHYGILKISRDAPTEVVRAAYKAMALKYHPDTNKDLDAHVRMESINAAYAILSNSVKRQEYDHQLKQELAQAKTSTTYSNGESQPSAETTRPPQNRSSNFDQKYSNQNSRSSTGNANRENSNYKYHHRQENTRSNSNRGSSNTKQNGTDTGVYRAPRWYKFNILAISFLIVGGLFFFLVSGLNPTETIVRDQRSAPSSALPSPTNKSPIESRDPHLIKESEMINKSELRLRLRELRVHKRMRGEPLL